MFQGPKIDLNDCFLIGKFSIAFHSAVVTNLFHISKCCR